MTETGNSNERIPEEHIIREEHRTRKGGLTPKNDPEAFGTVLETLVLRELQNLANEQFDLDVHFARGWIVEDYGTENHRSASAQGASAVETIDSPRFDIIGYSGDVAWREFKGVPHALVPSSFVYGVVELKRTLFPKDFKGRKEDGNINPQLKRQREHLVNHDIEGPHILVGIHYNRKSGDRVSDMAKVNYTALLGDLAEAGDSLKMATSEDDRRDDRQLAKVLCLLVDSER